MVRSFVKSDSKNNIKADVIILGCSLPGIVTAHKLKKRFGDTMDIVVLDLAASTAAMPSKCNVVFQEEPESVDDNFVKDNEQDQTRATDNVARYYLCKFMNDFNMPIPEQIRNPKNISSFGSKLFQFNDGQTIGCPPEKDYHDFEFLNKLERFELNQYQNLVDHCMITLFQSTNPDSAKEKKMLLYYDQTSMEKHICDYLFFSTPRDIMRITVRLVCGAPAENVSVLFYLHQCYRTGSSRNILDGNNTRFREKLLGYCRKHLASKLQKSVADITLSVYPIKEIRTYCNKHIILETNLGSENYVCNLLAMALRPEQLCTIKVEGRLLSASEFVLASNMLPGSVRKFLIQYENNFWNRDGYSGDILSIRGPILWAMERPMLSNTGGDSKSSGLVGYLKVLDPLENNTKTAVIEQLVKLFGEEAANPISYRETDIQDFYVPRCGDYVALRRLTSLDVENNMEWGALDVFADGDLAAALEAGHTTYVKLMRCLRPQAQSYDDACAGSYNGHRFPPSSIHLWLSKINVTTSMQFTMYASAFCVTVYLVKSYFKR